MFITTLSLSSQKMLFFLQVKRIFSLSSAPVLYNGSTKIDNSVSVSTLNKATLSVGSAHTATASTTPACQVVYANSGDQVTAVLAENPLGINKLSKQQVRKTSNKRTGYVFKYVNRQM